MKPFSALVPELCVITIVAIPAVHALVAFVLFFDIPLIEEALLAVFANLVSAVLVSPVLETAFRCSEPRLSFFILIVVSAFISFVVETMLLFEFVLVVDFVETGCLVSLLVAAFFPEFPAAFTLARLIKAAVMAAYVMVPLFLSRCVVIETTIPLFVKLLEDSFLERVKTVVP